MKKKDEIEKKERELGVSPGSYLRTLEAICRPEGRRVRPGMMTAAEARVRQQSRGRKIQEHWVGTVLSYLEGMTTSWMGLQMTAAEARRLADAVKNGEVRKGK